MRVEMLGLLTLERAGSRRGLRLTGLRIAEGDHLADVAFQILEGQHHMPDALLGGGLELGLRQRIQGIVAVDGGEGVDRFLGLPDGDGHFLEIGPEPGNGLPIDARLLEPVHGLQDRLGVRMAVAPGIFLQEPAAARRLHDGGLDGVEIQVAERDVGLFIGHGNGIHLCRA